MVFSTSASSRLRSGSYFAFAAIHCALICCGVKTPAVGLSGLAPVVCAAAGSARVHASSDTLSWRWTRSEGRDMAAPDIVRKATRPALTNLHCEASASMPRTRYVRSQGEAYPMTKAPKQRAPKYRLPEYSRSTAAVLLCALGAPLLPGALIPGAQAEEARHTKWAIAVHGGAGEEEWLHMDAATAAAYHASLARALAAGTAVLSNGGRSIDAVEAAIETLEDDPLFNAG